MMPIGVRPRCGHRSGFVAELVHQCLRIRYRPPVSNKWKYIQRHRPR